ncbi:amine oxidase [Lacihabitans sp. LS3-19]|uniref:flavin monoamine oxidase family protein n=1 Tax=Lacihabitans sp. LS3-19 TaxID=2487335 RepID=UPI0020CEE2DF|nr:FAD-dependent oxidoreductase [Lacihabitans sp. LS3-19]MCP9766860.1 amine oxidase [Lacihabitans sp. LS3-19]
MTRKEFLKICGILGIGAPVHSAFISCKADEVIVPNFKGKVIIIGAGAGGLSAGYLLQQFGIPFEILEASAIYGGRMRINTDFADFPIPLGAEWLETSSGIFKEIVNDPSVKINIETVADDPDRKFVNSSWYNFFEQYIVPSISQNIKFNTIVKSIDYSGNQIFIKTQNGEYKADKVIVSVPLKILQVKDINFTPNLPQSKIDAIAGPTVWEGFKAFFEFSKNFYGDGHEYSISPKIDGQKIYYNASHGQKTSKNILGLFSVGKPAKELQTLSSAALKDFVLNELDGLFDKQASPNYIKHISQNWNNEPFIKGGYMSDYADWKTVKELSKSVADKIYFAGGAYTNGEDWVSVNTAALSAKAAVTELVK